MSGPTLDWSAFNLRKGLLAGLMLAVLIPLVAWLGKGGGTALVAALLTLAVNSASTRAQRVSALKFVLIGTVIVPIGLMTEDRLWLAGALAVVVTFLVSPALAVGAQSAARSTVLILAMLLSHALAATELQPIPTAVATLGGGLLAVALQVVADELRKSRTAADASDDEKPPAVLARPRGAQLTFALVNAATMATAVVLGQVLFPKYSIWVAITVAVTLQPRSGTLRRSVERTLGTALGVVIALTLAGTLNTTSSLTIAIAASAVLMVATMNVNDTLFATLLTTFLLLVVHATVGSGFDAGWSRLLATVVGAGLSLLAVGAFAVLQRDGQSVK